MITESLLVELKRAEEPVAQQPAFTFGAKTSEALSKAYNNSTIDEDVDDKVVAAGQK
jgi:hypothetical protein